MFDLTLEIQRAFGFTDPVVELSTQARGRRSGTRRWRREATEALTDALERSGLDYTVAEGEGAFYGPKVDFHFRDAIGRLWQLTTIQCDFALPERFDMEYTGEDNQRHRPVMIHRAILGTLERFIGVLIEHYAGAFPLWLAPEQVRFVPVADRHVEHCEGLAARARAAGSAWAWTRPKETVGKKIRAAQLMKAPYTLVVGDRDIEAGTFTVRDRAGDETRACRSTGSCRRSRRRPRPVRSRRARSRAADRREMDRLWSPWRMEYIQANKDEPEERCASSAASSAARTTRARPRPAELGVRHAQRVPLQPRPPAWWSRTATSATSRSSRPRSSVDAPRLLQRASRRAPRGDGPARLQHRDEPRTGRRRRDRPTICTGTSSRAGAATRTSCPSSGRPGCCRTARAETAKRHAPRFAGCSFVDLPDGAKLAFEIAGEGPW